MKPLDILNQPQALPADYYRELVAIYGAHVRGPKIDFDAIQAGLDRAMGRGGAQQAYDVQNGVAIIPVQSVLTKNTSIFSFLFGGTSTSRMRDAFNAAVQDPNVSAIVLHVDSPGGSVDGTQELAQDVFNARGQKPIVAFADGMMASAAYWIGSAADAVFIASDTTQVGSIGVVTAHVDVSRAEEAMGLKVTEITAGKFKRAASAHAPLSEEGRSTIQADLDHIYSVFLSDVGKHRGGMDAQQVHEQMADGRTFRGAKAIQAGLADGVSSLSSLVQRLSQGATAKDIMKSPGAVLPVSQSQPHAAGAAANPETNEKENNMAEKDTHFLICLDGENMIDAKDEADAKQKFKAEADKLREAGATAERQRIQDVLSQSMAGHEALVQTLAFDGKTTGPEAAVQVLKAEKEKTAKVHANLKEDAPKPAPHSPEKPPTSAEGEDKPLDPHMVAAKAREYMESEAKAGRTVTVSEAVTHITTTLKKEA